MKNFVFIVLFIIPNLSFSQRTLTDKQWIDDLEFMTKRLDSLYPNVYYEINKEQIQKKAKELRESIPSLSDDEIKVELLRIVTAYKDGHTSLGGKNLSRKLYPLRIMKFSDGFYINEITKENSKYIGAKVISFNNVAIEQVYEKFKEIASHDNSYSQEYYTPKSFNSSSLLLGFHIINSIDDKLKVTLKSKDNKEVTLFLNPVDREAMSDVLSWHWRWKEIGVPAEKYSQNVDTLLPYFYQNHYKSYWFKNINKKTTYFAFNAVDNDKEETFKMFNERLWKSIDSLKHEYLIIDLRNNGGGNNTLIEPLLHGIIKNDKINQKGHLFVITSKKTFSAAVSCAAWIEYHCSPIFVGEATGAGPNFCADADHSVLPNSKLDLFVSKYYWQSSWPWDKRKAIEPTIIVDFSPVDYFNFKDPIIEEILRYIKLNK